jgi:hypothetical protein
MRRLVTVAAAALMAVAGCQGGRRPGANQGGSTPLPHFVDVTQTAGIRFRHFTGADGRYYMPESVGPGGAFIDYDGDGWLDVFLVNSTNWPDRPPAGRTCALFRNLHDGHFRDVTREAGLHQAMYGQGCAVGDFDNDGWDDLLVTCLGQNHLYRNEGNGRFRDVTAGSGLDDSPRWAWHTSAAWFDYDRDGRLDLFVCRYVKWSPQTDIPFRNAQGQLSYAGPARYQSDASELYRNLGAGKFANVSRQSGISASLGKALGVVPVDEDGDGWTDLFVSNDMAPNHLWRNEAGRRFREIGQESGIAVGESGAVRAGMGLDIGDLRDDGGLALAIGNFSGQGTALFDKAGPLYSDRATLAGLVPATTPNLTFGLLFVDADRDGWQDLFLYNGHVDPYAQDTDGHPIFKQSPALFRGTHGLFSDVSDSAGLALQQRQVGRGCAWADWDNDGRPDLLLCENGGPAHLLRNDTPDAHHWLGVMLRGAISNWNGYGADVRLTTGSLTQRRWVRSGSSYLSPSDRRALFGLGNGSSVDWLEVRWPSGRVTRIDHPPVDHYLHITEPR